MRINRFLENYSRAALLVKKSVIFMVFFAPPALSNAMVQWSLPDGYGLYPDVLATIINGSGTIISTNVNCFTSSSDCTTGLVGSITYTGVPFSYTSGHTYKANLARVYPLYTSFGCQSTQITITDSLSASATSACLAVTCLPIGCSFTPNTISLIFPP